MTRATISSAEWRHAWHTKEDVVYLNAAGQTPMPRVSLEAVQASLEWKKCPNVMSDQRELDLPKRVRISIANLIGAQPEEIALTTGASTGLIALAYGLNWKPGDEILTAHREFPVQYTTWKPMEKREGVELKLIAPRDGCITAEDFIAARIRDDDAFLTRYDPARDRAEFEAAWQARESDVGSRRKAYEPNYEGSAIVFGPSGGKT